MSPWTCALLWVWVWVLGLGLCLLPLLPVNAEHFRANRCATDKRQSVARPETSHDATTDKHAIFASDNKTSKMQYKWNYARVYQLLVVWTILSRCCQAASVQLQLLPQQLDGTTVDSMNETQGVDTELRPVSWLRSAQNIISSPAGHVVVQVAKELIHRSAGNSQVRRCNLQRK